MAVWDDVVAPAVVLLAVILAIIIVIFAIPNFASIPIITSATSDALISGRDSMNAMFPWILTIVVSGLFLSVIGGARR